MYKHILITTDGSDLAQLGVEHGLALAQVTKAAVTLMTVTQPFPMMTGLMGDAFYTSAQVLNDFDQSQEQSARAILDAVSERAKALGVTAKTHHVADAQPADAIIRAAAELGCDLICMASHGRRGLKRLILGSQAAEVVSQASIPVLIVH